MISLKRIRTILSVEQYYQNSLRNHHPYKIRNYRSYDLAEELVKKLIYYENGIVVFNKPHGISFAQDNKIKEESFMTSNLYEALKKLLKCSELFPARVPERYATGVAIFCTTEPILKQVQKCLKSMRAIKQPAEFYECIVIGQPSIERGTFEGGITIAESPNCKQKGIKLVKECSINRVRQGEIKPVKLQHSTFSLSNYASRLIISTTRTKWHSVRVYAATEILSPILGDHIFGRRIRTVLGKPVLIDMFSPIAAHPQKLPNDLLSKLDLSSRNIDVPIHLHLQKVVLKKFGNNEYLEFTAQPPDYFMWTCEILNLNQVPKAAATN